MAHAGPLVIKTIAEQLDRELEEYETELSPVIQGQWQSVLSKPLAKRADRICQFGQALPGAGPVLTEFVITRADLVYAVWASECDADRLCQCLRAHLDAAAQLRRFAARVRCTAASAVGTGEGAASALQALVRSQDAASDAPPPKR